MPATAHKKPRPPKRRRGCGGVGGRGRVCMTVSRGQRITASGMGQAFRGRYVFWYTQLMPMVVVVRDAHRERTVFTCGQCRCERHESCTHYARDAFGRMRICCGCWCGQSLRRA